MALLLCLLLGGCGGATVGAKDFSVHAIDLPGAGRVLADGSGYSLYVYLPDERDGRDAGSPAPPHGRHSCCQVASDIRPRPGIDGVLLGTPEGITARYRSRRTGGPSAYLDDGPGPATGRGEGMGA